MKRKMKKKLIAFMLCMVLVICNSVSILADTPAAATTTAENQVSETKTAKNEKSSEENKSTNDNDTSKQSEETDETKDEAPEATTTEKKEETTEATTEEKEDATTATTEAEEPTTEATTEDKATTEAADETSESDKKKETTTTEEEKTTAAEENTEAPTELTYENDDVKITVSANTENAIPDGANLQVKPILEKDEETAEQYKEVVKELEAKSEKEEYAIAGFLAYDITFIDADGNEIEPSGEVKVSMDYKKKIAPVELKDEETLANTNVTVMHLEEDEKGQVKEVVDMSENDQLKKMDATEKKEVQTAEFVTDSFSAFTITWYLDGEWTYLELRTNYGYIENGRFVEFENSSKQPQTIEGYNQTVDLNQYATKELSGAPDDFGLEEIRLLEEDGKEGQFLKVDREGHWSPFGTYYDYSLQSSLNRDYGYVALEGYDDFYISPRNPVRVFYIYGDTNPGGGGDEPVIPPEEPENPLGEPEHNKTIERKNDGSYTLSLDVTGKQGDATPIDVLLIVDASDSMTSSRVKNVNSAINTLKNQLENAEIPAEIYMSAVTFNGPTRTGSENSSQDSRNGDAWVSEEWTTLDSFDFQLSTSECNGGTNWQAGVRKGEEQLTERVNVNSKKYVIFLTDGDPTFRYYGNDSSKTTGTGTGDYWGNNYDAAVNEWNSSANLSDPRTVKYVVDATGTSSNQCDDFARAIAGTELAGNNSTALNNSFKQIADNITAPSYTNVSIYDTLSEYAEFADNPNLKVYKGNEILAANEYTYRINRNNGTIRVDLLNGEALDKDVTYRITFDIVPSQKAYEDYAANDENDRYNGVKGDEGTDTNSSNPTSSNKPGFHSNERAYVSYSENGGSQLEADYKHPVIQVDEGSIPEPPEPGEPELSPPAHQKYIKDNGDGNYILSLDVTGKLGEADPIDILLIIDKSNSMDNTRRKNVNSAIYTLINNLQSAQVETEVNLGAVTFSGTKYDGANNDAQFETGWVNLNSIKTSTKTNWYGEVVYSNSFFELNSVDGGTNWQAGIRTGEQAFAGRDSKKYVIFLTDGVPTFRYDQSGITEGDGNSNEWNQDDVMKNYNAAVDEWEISPALISAGKYVIDATSGDKLNTRCENFAEEIGATPIKGNNETSLKNAFATIADNITRPAYNSLIITDTLSDYVDFANGEQTTVTVSTCTKTIQDDGTFTITSKNPLSQGQYTTSINEDTKTITVDLSNVGKLEEDVTYLVEFDVRLTDAAKAEYAQYGYGNVVGDPYTDAPGNATSSGKPGLHSNDQATIKYKVDESAVQEELYDHPVVQPQLETVSKTVKKEWIGEPTESVQMQLKAEVDTNNNGHADLSLTHDDYASLPENMTVELNTNDGWQYTWNDLPKFFYRTTATGDIETFEIQYSIDEVNVPKGYTKEVSDEVNNTITITNTQFAYLEVVKNWNTDAFNGDSSGSETPGGDSEINDGAISHAPVSVGLFKEEADGSETLVENSVVELYGGNGWYHRYSVNAQDLEDYVIKEVITSETGQYVAKVDANKNVIIKDEIGDNEYNNIYSVAYSEPQENAETGNQRITITNTLQLGSIEITKTNTDIDPTPDNSLLPGAVFKITNKAGEEVATLTTGDGRNGTKKGIATLSNLLPGEYTITEIQSPAGYSLLANPVTVIVGTTEGNSKTDNYYEVVNDDDKHYYDLKLKIINNKLFTMPEAGGRNIFLLTLAGTAMIALAGGSTIYYRRRRGVHNRCGR